MLNRSRRSRDGGVGAMLSTNTGRKVGKLVAMDIEVPLEEGAHLPLHLIDLLYAKHPLSDDFPRMA